MGSEGRSSIHGGDAAPGFTRLRRGAGAAAAERVHRGEPGCSCPCCRRDREAAWRSGPPMARDGPGWGWGWVVAAGRACSRTWEAEDVGAWDRCGPGMFVSMALEVTRA